MPKFLSKNAFGIDIFETIGKINLALMDWGYGKNELAMLSREQEDLLRTYLDNYLGEKIPYEYTGK